MNSSCIHENNHINNIPTAFLQVGSVEGGVYTTFPLPCEGSETVSDKLPAQAKHNKIKKMTTSTPKTKKLKGKYTHILLVSQLFVE